MKEVWIIIRGFFGLTFCFVSIVGFANGYIAMAFPFLILGLLVLPPVTYSIIFILIKWAFILLIGFPFLGVAYLINRFQAQRFWKGNADKEIFFYSSRHGWREFTLNNIVPILSSDVVICNVDEDKSNSLSKVKLILKRNNISDDQTRLPFIVKLTLNTPKFVSIHSLYSNTKHNYTKKDTNIQNEIKSHIHLEMNKH